VRAQDKIAARDQRTGERFSASRAQQTDEARRISGRHIHSFNLAAWGSTVLGSHQSPQGFILAVGKITKVPVVDDGDQIIVGHRMSLTMSCDHRVIDGALGAEYLKELRTCWKTQRCCCFEVLAETAPLPVLARLAAPGVQIQWLSAVLFPKS